MTIDVEVGGRRRRVATTRVGNAWRVSVDDKVFDVDAARAGEWWSLLVGPAKPGRQKGDVEAAFRRPSES